MGLFATVVGTLGAGSAAISVGFVAGDPALVLGVTVSVAMLVPLPWILFSFEYLGHERLTSTLTSGILAAPVAAGLLATVVIFAGQVVPWVTSAIQTDAGGLAAVVGAAVQLGQWAGILYAGGLVLTGTGLVLWSFQRYPHLDSTTGAVLGTFGTVPWVSVLFALQLQSTSFFTFSGTVAVGFGVGAVTAAWLVGPAPLFDRVPAPGNIGPTTIMGELEDAVVITGVEGQTIELNRSAGRLFDREQDGVNDHITDLVGSTVGELRDQPTVEIGSTSRMLLYNPTVSELTDQHEYVVGYAVVFRDVTDRTVRKQRLEVLNRVLRHNIRNDMNVILGQNERVRTQVDDPDVVDSTDSIARAGHELMSISEKVRRTEQLFESNSGETDRIRVESLVERMFEEVRSAHDVACQYRGPEEVAIAATRDQVRTALRNLVTNAVQHNDSEDRKLWVRVADQSADRYPVTITVLDNGPGIPEQERAVIDAGQETPLEHSSGIGLWTVCWIMRKLGGELSFDEREPSGAAVKLLFPSPQRPESGRDDERIADGPTGR